MEILEKFKLKDIHIQGRSEIMKPTEDLEREEILLQAKKLGFTHTRTSYLQSIYFINGENWGDNPRLRAYLDSDNFNTIDPKALYFLEYKNPLTGEKDRLYSFNLNKFAKFVYADGIRTCFEHLGYDVSRFDVKPIKIYRVITKKREYYTLPNSQETYPRITIDFDDRLFTVNKEIKSLEQKNYNLFDISDEIQAAKRTKTEVKISKNDKSTLAEELRKLIVNPYKITGEE